MNYTIRNCDKNRHEIFRTLDEQISAWDLQRRWATDLRGRVERREVEVLDRGAVLSLAVLDELTNYRPPPPRKPPPRRENHPLTNARPNDPRILPTGK